jgi:hypothetical protein
LVLPFSGAEANDPKNYNTIPYPMTYTDDSITVR